MAAVTAVFACAGFCRVSAAPATNATALLQKAYDAQCADIVAESWSQLTNTFSPDFSLHSDGATYTRDDVVNSLKQAAGKLRFGTCTTTVDSVTESSGVYITVMRQMLDGSQASHTFQIATGKRDMWVLVDGALLEQSSTSLWQTQSLDGRVVEQSGVVPTPAPTTSPQ